MIASGRYSEDQVQALTFALKADLLYDAVRNNEAQSFAVRAVELDPDCTDGYRVYFRTLQDIPRLECDSLICLYRSLLFAQRERLWVPLLRQYPGKAKDHFELQPYLRLLHSIAAAGIISDKAEVSLFALEEILRTDCEDVTGASEYLLFNYLTIRGDARQPAACYVERTSEQLEAFLRARLPGATRPLFDPKNPCFAERWLRIITRYQKDQEWVTLLKAELRRDKIMPCFLFEENIYEFVPNHRKVGRTVDSLRSALIGYPAILKKAHDIARRPEPDFDLNVNSKVDNIHVGILRGSKATSARRGYEFLENGRESLRKKEYEPSYFMFLQGRRNFVQAMRPGERFYMNAPFMVSSNRATCLESGGLWPIPLLDTRFTLLMQPNHMRSYERLPMIADGMHAPQLQAYVTMFVKEIRDRPDRSIAEWRKTAARAIALISLTAVTLSRLGKLTEGILAHLTKVGIEDFYEPVNVGVDVLPVLPWLTDADLEQI
jgi:hypothetical protein